MTRFFFLLLSIIWVSGCSGGAGSSTGLTGAVESGEYSDLVIERALESGENPSLVVANASRRWGKAAGAKATLLWAQREDQKYEEGQKGGAAYLYCRAASEFLRAGGREDVRNAIDASARGLAIQHRAHMQYGDSLDPNFAHGMLICGLIHAESRLSAGDRGGMHMLAKDYAGLDAMRAVFVFDRTMVMPNEYGFDNLGARMVKLLRTHAPELAEVVERHYQSSSLKVGEQQK